MLVSLCVSAQKTWDGGGGNTNWNTPANWNPDGVPAAGQSVTIGNGFTVVLNTSATIASLTLGGGSSGQLTIGNSNTDRILTVTGDVTVNNGATLIATGNGGNVLRIGGNLVNNGVFTDNAGDVDVEFIGTSNQTISGTGTTTSFNFIEINNTGAANNNIVEVQSSSFSAANDFLILTDGIFKLSSNITITPFTTTGYIHVPAGCGLWNNGGTINTSGFEFVVEGILRVTAGVTNIGNASDQLLRYITGSQIIIEGGTLNAVGSIRPDVTASTTTYNQSGGTVNCGSLGTTSTTTGVFDLSATGSVFTMSGGTIVLIRPNTSFAGADYLNLSATNNVTGGTIQIGNASTPASQTFDINSTSAIFNLTVNAVNAPVARLISNNLTVHNNITISGGTLNANNLNISLGGSWTNNGTFTTGTGTVTFNGASLQTINGTASTTFNNIIFNNTSGGIVLSQSTALNGTATFTSGIVTSTNTNLITFNAGAAAVNASSTAHVNGPVAKTGTTAFTFPVGNGTIYRPIAIGVPTTSTTFRAQFFRTNPVIAVSPYSLGTGLSRISSCEYWLLDRTAGTGNTTVTLSWGANSPCNTAAYVTNIADLRVARHSGGVWANEGQTASTGTTTAGTITSGTISSFSPFALGTTGALNPLPAELSTLSALKNGGVIALQFRNYAERDVLRYEWMRSSNGRDFNQFQTAQPSLNNGAEATYNTTDAAGAEATVFYRVKVILTDGQQLYSSIVKVTGSKQKSWNILPNPVTQSQLMIQFNQFESGTYDLSLMSSNGQKVLQSQLMVQGNFMTSLIRLPQGLLPGTYYVMITGKQERLTKTILIQ